MSKIIVLVEQQQGKLVKASLNALGAARILAEKTGGGFDIAVAGVELGPVAEGLAKYGAEAVYVLEDPLLKDYTAQAYAQAFHTAVLAADAEYVVAAATARGKDCTPRVAARLEAGQASEIVDIIDEGELLFVRPMWAGSVLGKVRINTDVKVLTVRHTDFEVAPEVDGASDVEALDAGLDAGALRMKFVKLDEAKSDRPSLTEASVVVSGGRGLKNAENFEALAGGLADALGGALGATRAVVDAGWAANDLQVGQTGKVVAPDLYIALGISGAIQHLAGMKGSKIIVAVNTEEEEPIFGVADYGLVGDVFEVVPELLAKLKAR